MDGSRGEEAVDGIVPTGPLSSRTRVVDGNRLRTALTHDDPPFAYWESPDGCALAGVGSVDVLSECPPERIRERAERTWSRVQYDGPDVARPRMLGGRSFDGRAPNGPPWSGFPATFFFLPRHLVVQKTDTTWHTVTTPVDAPAPFGELTPTDVDSPTDPPRVADASPMPPREVWTGTVSGLLEAIENGAFRKVVLAHSLDVTLDRSPTVRECIDRLRRANPGCYICLVRPSPDAMFVAATPERLVSRRGGRIQSGALAGSIGRGTTSSDDERLSTTLRSDDKEGHEHQLVVEAIERDLRSLGAAVTIEDRRIRRLRSVQHLYTPVTADHRGEPHVLDVVETLHPTPAVGGLPRADALRAIQERESFDRGWYAAPLGWLDADGDGTFAVGIRSAVIRGRDARLFAGAGIVNESDPADEWDEVQWKYRPILDTFIEA